MVGYGIELGHAAAAGSADAFAQAWPETAGKRIVLFLGRLHEKKGCDLLVEAFARVAGADPSLHLVMAGPDDAQGLRAGLEARAAQWGVAERVTWTGMLAGEAKWSALKAAQVFALPSHQENFGIAVVEALALGVPVLISEKVNIWREIIQSGAGFADSDTLDGTVACLTRWLALALAPAEYALMRERAVRCFERNYHMTAAAQRLIDTIAPHIGRAAQPARALGLDSQS